jgi:hypothetical protein
MTTPVTTASSDKTADERCEQRVALRDARAVVASPHRSPGIFGYDSNLMLDYFTKLCYRDSHPRSEGAFSRNDPEGGAGSGVSRLRREPQRGRSGIPPARSLRPGAGRSLVGSGATAGGGSTGPRPKIATVERREGVPVATGRPAFRSRGRRASHARHKREECACRRSAHPLLGWTRKEKREPGRNNAPRERITLRCLTS